MSGDAATVDLVSGATTVTVRAADLGGADRLRALTPDGAGVAPVLDTDGDTVRVHLVRTGEPGPAEVTVLLDRRVRWQVRMSGGATSELLDLRSARLSGVDLAAGAARIELVLPVPDRAVPITMAGGATSSPCTCRAESQPRCGSAAARPAPRWTASAAPGWPPARCSPPPPPQPVRRRRDRGRLHADADAAVGAAQSPGMSANRGSTGIGLDRGFGSARTVWAGPVKSSRSGPFQRPLYQLWTRL